MNAESRRALGYGLLTVAAGIAVLLLAWLLVSGVQTGGLVLGLLLLFVLAGPLAALCWYVLASGRAEGIAEQAFVGKRRIVDAARLFREELTPQLRQLALAPELPESQRLRIADDLDRTVKDESAWYAAIQLDDAQAAVLKQYDDLVWERVRWLRDHTGERTDPLADAVNELLRDGGELGHDLRVGTDFEEAGRLRAEDYVNRLGDRLRRSGFQASGLARIGAPATVIEETVREHQVDLIVMGTHALTGPARALLGSVADRVVHSTDRPVLLVRQNGSPGRTLPGRSARTQTGASQGVRGRHSSPWVCALV